MESPGPLLAPGFSAQQNMYIIALAHLSLFSLSPSSGKKLRAGEVRVDQSGARSQQLHRDFTLKHLAAHLWTGAWPIAAVSLVIAASLAAALLPNNTSVRRQGSRGSQGDPRLGALPLVTKRWVLVLRAKEQRRLLRPDQTGPHTTQTDTPPHAPPPRSLPWPHALW